MSCNCMLQQLCPFCRVWKLPEEREKHNIWIPKDSDFEVEKRSNDDFKIKKRSKK
jgi:hypothetical protein